LRIELKLWKTREASRPLLQNRFMKSMTFMELQENASGNLASRIRNCNTIRLQLLDGSCRQLTAPKLGREFLAGSLEDGQSLGLFRKSIIRSAEFVLDSNLESGFLEYTRKAIGELLSTATFPALARVSYLEYQAKSHQVRAIGIARSFVFTDFQANPAIPIAALGSLELEL
jgi:hypothetical protein